MLQVVIGISSNKVKETDENKVLQQKLIWYLNAAFNVTFNDPTKEEIYEEAYLTKSKNWYIINGHCSIAWHKGREAKVLKKKSKRKTSEGWSGSGTWTGAVHGRWTGMDDRQSRTTPGWMIDNNGKWLWHIAILIHTETELRVMLINLTAISTGFWIRKDMKRKAEG